MEKEVISFDDIRVVAKLADSLILLVKVEDVNNKDAIGIQLHLNTGEFSRDNINLFVKFSPFEGVDVNSKTIQKYYQELIYRKLNDNTLFEILSLINKDE